MVLMAIFTTFITTPLVMALYKTSETTQTQDSDSYKNCKRRRKIESEKEEEQTQQLKVLICLQSGKDINPMVKLIEASHGRNLLRLRYAFNPTLEGTFFDSNGSEGEKKRFAFLEQEKR